MASRALPTALDDRSIAWLPGPGLSPRLLPEALSKHRRLRTTTNTNTTTTSTVSSSFSRHGRHHLANNFKKEKRWPPRERESAQTFSQSRRSFKVLSRTKDMNISQSKLVHASSALRAVFQPRTWKDKVGGLSHDIQSYEATNIWFGNAAILPA